MLDSLHGNLNTRQEGTKQRESLRSSVSKPEWDASRQKNKALDFGRDTIASGVGEDAALSPVVRVVTAEFVGELIA